MRLKSWRREKKETLIEKMNPTQEDVAGSVLGLGAAPAPGWKRTEIPRQARERIQMAEKGTRGSGEGLRPTTGHSRTLKGATTAQRSLATDGGLPFCSSGCGPNTEGATRHSGSRRLQPAAVDVWWAFGSNAPRRIAEHQDGGGDE